MSSSAVIFLVCDIVKCTFFFSLKKKQPNNKKHNPTSNNAERSFPAARSRSVKHSHDPLIRAFLPQYCLLCYIDLRG